MRQRRPSLSITPYPVAPAAAGSTPSTRIKLPFVWGVRGTAMSVRRGAAPGHNFLEAMWHRLQPVGFRPCKDENPQAEACATENLLRGHYSLHFFFVDIEVGGNFLNVVVFFERLDQPQHLSRLSAC